MAGPRRTRVYRIKETMFLGLLLLGGLALGAENHFTTRLGLTRETLFLFQRYSVQLGKTLQVA